MGRIELTLTNDETSFLLKIFEILKPYYDATIEMETGTEVTSSEVLPSITHLFSRTENFLVSYKEDTSMKEILETMEKSLYFPNKFKIDYLILMINFDSIYR